MLARTYLTAAELQISEELRDALIKVHGKLLRGEIPEEQFDMRTVGKPWCGTPGCLLGWAYAVAGRDVLSGESTGLFCGLFWCGWAKWKPTTAQAGVALGHYLATGSGSDGWKLALGLSNRKKVQVRESDETIE